MNISYGKKTIIDRILEKLQETEEVLITDNHLRVIKEKLIEVITEDDIFTLIL